MVKVTKDSIRRTLRTALAVTVAVASVVLALVQAGTIDPEAAPWLGTIVVVATGITRAMQSPAVDKLLGTVLGASWTRDGVIPTGAPDVGVPVVEQPVVDPEQAAVWPPDPRYPPGL